MNNLLYFPGDLGGCLGLTLGASLLTICEVVEYMAKSIKQLLFSKGGHVKKDIKPPIQKITPISDNY